MKDSLTLLQRRINYTFKDTSLLERALIHPSYAAENPGVTNNQRLEFLGDSVLQILLAEALYHKFPGEREGVLSTMRSQLVQGPFLARLGNELSLESHIILSPGDEQTGGRQRPTTIGDAFEAVIGAIYLDSDLASTRQIVMNIYGDLDARLAAFKFSDANPKGRLQERVQPVHGTGALRYETVPSGGPDHAKEYRSTVFLADRALGTGTGTSKKAAEEAAARSALAEI